MGWTFGVIGLNAGATGEVEPALEVEVSGFCVEAGSVSEDIVDCVSEFAVCRGGWIVSLLGVGGIERSAAWTVHRWLVPSSLPL